MARRTDRAARAWSNLYRSPVFAALNRQPTPEADLNNLRAGELLALADFSNGTAGAVAWRDLDDMRRVSIELARAGIGAELLPLADQAADILARAARRAPPMHLDDADLDKLRALQVAHDCQRRMATRGEFIRANHEAIERQAAQARQATARPGG